MNLLEKEDIMIIKASSLSSSRREFLLNIFPLGTLFCFGCGTLSALTAAQEAQKAVEKKVITEESDTVIASRITECLYAKTFRDLGAPDIGYAWACHGDFAYDQAFNPKLRLIRDKTLMNGDDYCNPRRVWEG
jgi:hypothetical protein